MAHSTTAKTQQMAPAEQEETEASEQRPDAELRTTETTIQVFDFGYTVPDVTCRLRFEHCLPDHPEENRSAWLDLAQVDRLIALLNTARLEMIELEKPSKEPY